LVISPNSVPVRLAKTRFPEDAFWPGPSSAKSIGLRHALAALPKTRWSPAGQTLRLPASPVSRRACSSGKSPRLLLQRTLSFAAEKHLPLSEKNPLALPVRLYPPRQESQPGPGRKKVPPSRMKQLAAGLAVERPSERSKPGNVVDWTEVDPRQQPPLSEANPNEAPKPLPTDE